MPFGIFVGVNNHFQSIILGGVLLREETTESFKWVFSEFVRMMGGKPPQTILTGKKYEMVLPHENKNSLVCTRNSDWPIMSLLLWCRPSSCNGGRISRCIAKYNESMV
jgi:hypothetical protein